MTNNESTKYRNVTHVIFDMDGLILDTETLYSVSTQNVIGKYGNTYTWELKSQLMGLTGPEVAKRIVQEFDLPLSVEEYMEQSRAEQQLLMKNCNVMPGAETLIKHLHAHKIPIALATSSSLDSFELKTTNHKKLFSHFMHIVTGASDPDVKAGKPCPDVFLVCASRFADKPKPENCLVFEDAPNGVEAAAAAGMQCVMVPDARTDPAFRKKATAVYPSLNEVELELFGLPPLV